MARLLTLDFTNTCAKVSYTVGHHYNRVAANYGINVSEVEINKYFKQHFTAQMNCYPNFGAYNPTMTCARWWNKVVTNTFRSCGVTDDRCIHQISDDLYDIFATSQCWDLYSDVRHFISSIKGEGFVIGIISNFDNRLDTIVGAIGLDSYFDFIVTSYAEQCHKPQAKIFERAFTRQRDAKILKQSSWHIGNDLVNDYYGSVNFGMNSILLCRGKDMLPSTDTCITKVRSLTDALPLVLEKK